jgi:uncharacterized protein YecT (DUF1311 family)
MKKIIMAALMACSVSAHAQLLTAGKMEYVKDHAGVTIQRNPTTISFSINSVVGQNTCELEGNAVMTGKDRYYYLPGNDDKQCEALFVFDGDKKLQVSTTNCDSACGLNAAGSMDGDYYFQPQGAITEQPQPEPEDPDAYACHGSGTKNTLLGIFFDDIAKEFGDDVAHDLADRISPEFDLIMIAENDYDTGAVYCTAKLTVDLSNLNMKEVVGNAAMEDINERVYRASGQHYESIAAGVAKPTSGDPDHPVWDKIRYKIQRTSDGSQYVVSLDNGHGFVKWFRMLVKLGALSPVTAEQPVKEESKPTPTPAPVAEVIKPSFDCAKASSVNEKLICGDAELAGMDVDLAATYKQAKASASDPVAFKQKTVDAWKWREANCHDKACLVKWYADRRASLASGGG